MSLGKHVQAEVQNSSTTFLAQPMVAPQIPEIAYLKICPTHFHLLGLLVVIINQNLQYNINWCNGAWLMT